MLAEGAEGASDQMNDLAANFEAVGFSAEEVAILVAKAREAEE